MSGLRIGIVGVTGLVGRETLLMLERSNLEIADLKLFASERSSGIFLNFRGQDVLVSTLDENLKINLDYMFFCTCSNVSGKFVPNFSQQGIVCIDNSSRYRMQDDVPLIVPEINAHRLKMHRNIIANPNCSTIIALMALAPLHSIFELSGFCVSTYQAVSGVGRDGISALMEDLDGKHELSTKIFGRKIGFNALPRIGEVNEEGYSLEEQKMSGESRKILAQNDLKISAMCVRIPTIRAHAMSIFASFKKKPDLAKAKNVLKENKNINFYDGDTFPCLLDASGEDLCAVSRLRLDSFMKNGLSMWVVGDQIKKGAALNAFQIMLAMENLG